MSGGAGPSGGAGAAGGTPIASGGSAGSATIAPTAPSDASTALDVLAGCSGVSSMTDAVPPVLEFLVDTSASMLEKAPGGTQSKWEATRSALGSAVTNMRAGTGFGMIYYPNMFASRGECLMRSVAVPIAPLNDVLRSNVLASLQSVRATGNTPTHDAYRYALETLGASTLPGGKYVVLVTDGAPTFSLGCVGNGLSSVDTAPLIDEAAKAKAAGIKTFVIGSPGSESARAALSRMATAGGTASAGCSDTGPTYCHFDMTTVADLSAALNAAVQTITGRVVSCDYPIPPPPSGMQLDYDLVNVTVTDAVGTRAILRDNVGTSCNAGWDYSADKQSIALCPGACTSVKADPASRVDVVFGCKTAAVTVQ